MKIRENLDNVFVLFPGANIAKRGVYFPSTPINLCFVLSFRFDFLGDTK